jgi:hypothetical protein
MDRQCIEMNIIQYNKGHVFVHTVLPPEKYTGEFGPLIQT